MPQLPCVKGKLNLKAAVTILWLLLFAVYPKSSTILILVFRKSKYLWYNGLALPIGRIGQR